MYAKTKVDQVCESFNEKTVMDSPKKEEKVGTPVLVMASWKNQETMKELLVLSVSQAGDTSDSVTDVCTTSPTGSTRVFLGPGMEGYLLSFSIGCGFLPIF